MASTPAMIGDLLGGPRVVSFFYNRVGSIPGLQVDPLFNIPQIEETGIINLRNSKIAENNSPLPRNRFSFRYNFFHNAQDTTGFTTRNPLVINQTGPVPAPGDYPAGIPLAVIPTELPPVIQVRTLEKSEDVDLFTFAVERTLFDNLLSVELRVPFSNSLASDLDLRVGQSSDTGNGFLDTRATPGDSFGPDDVQFGNLTVILKGLLHQANCVAFSGGLGLGIPTAEDTELTVTDFRGTAVTFENPFRIIPLPSDTVRTQTFEVDNNTWSLSPYLAALLTPTDKSFLQGFMQVEIPLNQSDVSYQRQNRAVPGALLPLFVPSAFEDIDVRHRIQEQTLLHLDLGGGYWFLRCPEACHLTGLAGLLELHYTSTLNDADVVTLPGSQGFIRAIDSVNAGRALVEDARPQVGNQANRMDILNLTAGLTFELWNSTTITPAVVAPLRDGDDRIFDWEFNLQVNVYR